MARKQCENCGAPYEVDPSSTETTRRCGYCGALLDAKSGTLFGVQRPPARHTSHMGIVLGAAAALIVVGVAVAVLLGGGRSAVTTTPGPPPPPSSPSPPSPPPALPPSRVVEPPAPPPPRERTVNDDIRDFFLKADGRLCVAGNLSRFGPFAGSVQLTAHPEGRVSELRLTMQPDAPQVTRCLRRAFSRGPVYRGRAVGVVYHFGGGRSADGLQYHEGIELKGSAN